MAAGGIDAHNHFWDYSKEQYPWMGPQHAPIAQDFGPSHLQPLLAAASLRGSIAVQARQSLEETEALLALAEAHPATILGVVGWVELCAPPAALAKQLDALASRPALKGVRHVVHDEEDDAFMLRPAFRAGIGALAARGLAYDLLIFPKHLPAALALVAEFPAQRFMVDHIAKPRIPPGGGPPDAAWLAGMRALAAHPNVHCKLSGMVTEHAAGAGWAAADFYPYLDALLEAFGARRLVYGSDWPVCLLAASYAGQHGIVAGWAAARLSEEEAAGVMGGNAAAFYGLWGAPRGQGAA